MQKPLDTPVLFLIFNRPDTTKKVFDAIRLAAPSKLYIAADGPRETKPSDIENCRETRNILNEINWTCEVHTLFREKNLGCRVAVSSAIDWFFENEEEGIILEDDCLPDQSFFWFCSELLNKYRNNTQIMHIGGSNFQFGRTRGEASYYFSRLAHIWGWASWRRAWKYYDVNMESFPEFLTQNKISTVFANRAVQQEWIKSLTKIYKGANTWDYQWAYTIIMNNGYCIIPNENLVSNIGFGAESTTHATDENDKLANIKSLTISNLIHPAEIKIDIEADNFTGIEVFSPQPLLTKIKNKLIRSSKYIKGRKL